MSLHLKAAACRILAVAILMTTSAARAADTPLTSVRLASGLAQPLQITHAPGDATRMFIVERTGRIKVLDLTTNTVLATPFLNLSGLVGTGWLEYGLLGLVFHPDYASNGIFYVNYTPTGATIADTLVVRYQVSADPNIADAASATTILRFGFGTRREHRAGWMGFGPDGYLYISTGDGGENDPDNAAQNLTLLRGKMLRIDVNGPDGIPASSDDDGFPADANKLYHIPADNPYAGSVTNAKEIWAAGLRNPWRCSFDRLTGDLWIGDVGQAQREEIDFQAAGTPGGLNFGWRCTEGTACTSLSGCTCNAPTLTPPVFEYPRSVGVSVTGGYVYRGCAIPDLRGTYFYADYQVSKVFSLRYEGGVVSGQRERTAELAPGGGLTLGTPSSFGEDDAGELYICDYGGEVYKIVAAAPPGPSLFVTQQPAGLATCDGGDAVFHVAATSVGSPAAYQWRLEGAALSDDGAHVFGATTAALHIAAVTAADLGDYDCVLTNACASVTSDSAALTIEPPAGDVNGDGRTDLADLSILLAHFGQSEGAVRADGDLSGDGAVNLTDLSILLGGFGAACS